LERGLRQLQIAFRGREHAGGQLDEAGCQGPTFGQIAGGAAVSAIAFCHCASEKPA